MFKARFFRGGYSLPSNQKGGKALKLVSFQRLPKGGLRCLDKGVTPYG